MQAIVSARAARLSGIEALRGAAATAVVLYHAARHVHKAFGAQGGAPGLATAFQAGHAGVDLFFVLSGFIILFVHRADIGRPDRLMHYLGRRFTRVMPLYWVGLALTVVLATAAGHTLALSRVAVSAALLPTLDEPVLGVAWTLQFEVVFYAVFAVLILHRAAGLVLLAAWLAWIAAASCGLGVNGVPSALCGTYGLEFFMGMSAAEALHRGLVPVPRLMAGVGLLLLAGAGVMESTGFLDGYAALARFAYGLPAALLVLSVAEMDRAGGLSVPGWLRRLGGASYSIYLFQFVFIGVLWQAWLAVGMDRHAPVLACFLALSVAAVAGGLVMARLVEQPLLRLLRGRRGVLTPQQA